MAQQPDSNWRTSNPLSATGLGCMSGSGGVPNLDLASGDSRQRMYGEIADFAVKSRFDTPDICD